MAIFLEKRKKSMAILFRLQLYNKQIGKINCDSFLALILQKRKKIIVIFSRI